MTRRVLILTLVPLLAIVALGSVAFAYWSSTGAGNGSASVAGAPAAITVATNGTAGALLQPGGTGDLVVSVSNPNPYSIQITAITGTGTVTAGGGIGSCSATGVSVLVPAGDLPITVLANAAATRFTLASAVSMSTASESGCQGATFTIGLNVTARK